MQGNEDGKKLLKAQVADVLDSSVKKRTHAFRALRRLLNETDDKDAGLLKGLCKMLLNCLVLYRDKLSKMHALDFMLFLNAKYGEKFRNMLLPLMKDLFSARSKYGSRVLCALALEGEKWIVAIGSDVNTKLPIGYHHLLTELCLYTQGKKVERLEQKRILKLCGVLTKDDMKTIFKEIIQDDSGVVYASLLIRCLQILQICDDDLLDRKLALEKVIKFTLLSKERKNPSIVRKCGSLLNYAIDNDSLKQILIPALSKSILRSAETAMEVIGCMIESLEINLDAFSEQIAKTFLVSLTAVDDNIREYAKSAALSLSSKLRKPEALINLVSLHFDLLSGSNGKLNLAGHKIGIIETIKKMKNRINCSRNDLASVADSVTQKAVFLFQSEVNEPTLVELAELISEWIGSTSGSTLAPPARKLLLAQLTEGKVSVRPHICKIIVSWFASRNPYVHDEELCTCVVKRVEKSLPQITSMSGCVEVLVLLSYLLDISKEHPIPDGISSACTTIFAAMNDKFFSSCSDWVPPFATRLCVVTLQSKPELKPSDAFFDALVSSLCYSSYKVRAPLVNYLQRNFEIFAKDVSHIHSTFKAFKRIGKGIENDLVEPKIVRLMFQKFVQPLVNLPKQNIALELLDVAHAIGNQEFWHHIASIIRYENDTFKNPQLLIERYVKQFEVSSASQLTTINIRLGDVITSSIIDEAVKYLNDPDILNVKRDDYFIMHTEDGHLFDTSVLDTTEKNMKRESKVYSYREQLEEMKLRTELEQKRKREGKNMPLTPKQKENLKNQLEKESLIRKQLKALDEKVAKGFNLLNSSLEGDIKGFFCLRSKMHLCISLIFKLLKSALSAPYAMKFLTRLSACLHEPIEQESVRYDFKCSFFYIVHACLKVQDPQCDYTIVCPDWTAQETIQDALMRFDENFDWMKNHLVHSSVFSFLLPVFKRVSNILPENVKLHEHSLSILNKLMVQINRGSSISPYNSKLFCRSGTCEYLYYIMKRYESTIRMNAYKSLIILTEGPDEETLLKLKHVFELDFIEPREIEIHLENCSEPIALVREAAVKCLKLILRPSYWHFQDEALPGRISNIVYRCQFDSDPGVSAICKDIWVTHNYQVSDFLIEALIKDLVSSSEEAYTAASKALAEALAKFDCDKKEFVLRRLMESYDEHVPVIPAVLDELGRELRPPIDRWEERCGIGLGIKEISSILPPETSKRCFTWLVNTALADETLSVHNVMLEASLELAKTHGKRMLTEFFDIIDNNLGAIGSAGRYDNVRQASVVLMGGLAKHLDRRDGRVAIIFSTLIDTLSTPSEKVQQSVANCLPDLVPAVEANAEEILNKLVHKLLKSETYGERRGAAYGLAGMAKGLGILSLKNYNVMDYLAKGMQDKKNYGSREGAMIALEFLSEFLGRLFEPYIVHVLPYLLQCLADPNHYVRSATENTSKLLMSRLSSHGVKLVLPALLQGLHEDSWRTKSGSVDLLGRMAYCAPRQLSGCLPSIVPKLIEVLGDSHSRVQEAGANALRMIGSVIKNPEISSVVPVLMTALQDPGKKTSQCLQALLQTEFVHVVDPPSVALIMPVVQRAFQDRSTENRKMAAQIIGNMYSLTHPNDLAPYIDKMMPGLKQSLLDPVPEVRAVAAKALGEMAKGLGQKCYEELLPWLMKTLISETSSVDRSGAAQGLAEIIGALGEEKLNEFMPEIIRKADSDDIAPHVRDGYMMMFIYVPSVFETEFVPYIGLIINPILKALADENEYVRDTALKAGQRIVAGFADTAITLLLPELEKGIFDDNWRIRYSSIQLLGDLLYKISGVSGKMSTESANDDDNFGTEQSQEAISNALGADRKNRVLAGLYMGRSDVDLMVRQASLHVWKVVVANTPKTLREILPTLFSLLLGCLASSSHDKQQVAARTLGDLVKKLGEKILPEIIPILEQGLDSERDDERQGVCIGLSEIMASTTKEMVMMFTENLVPTVRRALCDPVPSVRAAAAQTFGHLHSTVGPKALEEILPYMLEKLDKEKEADYALDGFGQLLQVKSKSVLPYLIPRLTSPPANTRALAVLSSVAGDSWSKHIPKIISCLISVITKMDKSTPEGTAELENCDQILLSVSDEYGVHTLIDELLEYQKSSNQATREASIILLTKFCIITKADIKGFVSQLLRIHILLLNEQDPAILKMSSDAILAITRTLGSSDKLHFVSDVRQALRFAASDLKGRDTLPGLCIPKGVAPILPIFREALLSGTADLKEQAATGMGEMVKLSVEEALKRSIPDMAGPLIRILGDRYGPTVKVAVIDTLTILLKKVGTHMKAFMPQVQTTLIKNSSDPNRNVRLKSAAALAELVPIHSKADMLFTDLMCVLKSADDASIRETMLFTLRCSIVQGGHKLSDDTRKNLTNISQMYMNSGDHPLNIRLIGASCLAALLKWMSPSELEHSFGYIMSESDDPAARHVKSTALVVGLLCSPNALYGEYADKVDKVLLSLFNSDKIVMVSNAIRGCGYLYRHCVLNDLPVPTSHLQSFSKSINNANNDVKTLLGNVVEVLGRRIYPKIINRELSRSILPAMVNGSKEKNSIVRASCEIALIHILQLRDGESTFKTCSEYLDVGARESLNDVVNKVLRKIVASQVEGKEPEVDDTILY